MTERMEWPKANNTWSTRRHDCSEPGCNKKAHNVLVTLESGQHVSDAKYRPVCKAHSATQLKEAVVHSGVEDDDDPLGSASLGYTGGTMLPDERAAEQEISRPPRIVGDPNVIKDGRNVTGSTISVNDPKYSGPRGVVMHKIDQISGQKQIKGVSISPNDPGPHLKKLEEHHALVKGLHENDPDGLRSHVNSVVKKYVNSDASWRSLSHGERAVIKSLDANNNLSMRLFNHHVSRARNSLISNSANRAPSATGKLLYNYRPDDAAVPKTPAKGAFASDPVTAGGVSQDYKYIAGGEVIRKRPGVAQRNASLTMRNKQWRKDRQGPVSDIIALRKAHLAGDKVMTKGQALTHEGYKSKLETHGGTEASFLAQYNIIGSKRTSPAKRKRTAKKAAATPKSFTEVRNGRQFTVTQLPTVMPRKRRSDAGKQRKVVDQSDLD